MLIEDNILRYYLRNVYFITGTAYAGKSTAAKLLSEQYGLHLCGENYFTPVTNQVADPEIQPNLCYIPNLKDWRDFVRRSPEEYAAWCKGCSREVVGFEIAHLISVSQQQKVIVDTNIPVSELKRIADYHHVAVMLSPQSMSVERFFDRSDPEKQFLLQQIQLCEHPEQVMKSYREGLALINSPAVYASYAESGFFTLVREDDGRDTRQQVCDQLAAHFGF